MSDGTRKALKKKVLSPEAAERRRARNRDYMKRIRQERKLAGLPMLSAEAYANKLAAYRKRYREDREFRELQKKRANDSSKRRYASNKEAWKRYAEARKSRMASDTAYAEKQRKRNREAAARRYRESEDVRKKHLLYFSNWAKRNAEHRRQYRRHYKKARLKSDVCFWLSHAVRSRFNIALRRGYKKGSAIALLGCSVEELKKHLERQFKDGMTWENRGIGGWHIDHIIPLSAFDLSDVAQLKIACHFSNLQPLWQAENLSKKASLPAGASARLRSRRAHSEKRGAKCKTTVQRKKK